MRNLFKALGNLFEACVLVDFAAFTLMREQYRQDKREWDSYNRGYQDAKRDYKDR